MNIRSLAKCQKIYELFSFQWDSYTNYDPLLFFFLIELWDRVKS